MAFVKLPRRTIALGVEAMNSFWEHEMRLKIFSCHHLPPKFTCNSEIFQTFVSNLPTPDDHSFMSDLNGVNIAGDNLFAELRHQYFVWKNLIGAYDYIGFEHYRRPFFIDPLPAAQLAAAFPGVMTPRLQFATFNIAGFRLNSTDFAQYLSMRQSLDERAIARVKDWIGSYDIVVPRVNAENIEQQWKSCHDHDAWDVMIEATRQSPFFKVRSKYAFFQIERCYFANMYIMRVDLLDEYLTFCFDVLERCRSRLPLTGRALGYFAERLFSFWLYQKRIENPLLRVLELPFAFHEPAFDVAEQRQPEAMSA